MSVIEGSNSLMTSVSNNIGENPYKLYANTFDKRSKYLSEFVQDHKIDALLSVIKLSRQLCFLDMGANYGEFSVPISFYVKRLIAVEANPLLIAPLDKSLRAVCAKNGCEARIISSAVSSQQLEYIDFTIDPYNSSGGKESSLHINPIKDKAAKLFNIRANVVSLSYLMKLCNQLNPSEALDLVVKMDIEGSELSILSEYTKLFAVNHVIKPPLAILFEYNSNSYHQSGKFYTLVSTFLGLGYVCYLLHPAPAIFRQLGAPVKLKNQHHLSNALNSPWELLLVKN